MNDQFTSLHVKRRRLHEEIAESIQEIIIGNQLRPGTRLPSERELAEQLGVSRVTVSQASQVLEQRGLIQRKVGGGTYVTDRARSAFAESMQRLFVVENCTFDDLIQLRLMLEPEAAAIAASSATPDELAELGRLVDLVEATSDTHDIEGHVAADLAFHTALAEATHNELILGVSLGVQKLMEQFIRVQDQGTTWRCVEDNPYRHRLVYEVLAARDPDRARERMHAHIENARNSYRSIIEGRGDSPGPVRP
jgi:GntR family transcriptional regulator, transcriptional repressor for pyruvate dehydrogenase complex